MSTASWIMIAVAGVVAFVLLQPRLDRLPVWRATVTPLASIIGSGFLVAAPILSETTGRWAFVAVAALCGAGLLFGYAIRFNITNAEPLLGDKTRPGVRIVERLSGLALALAYFISIAYYLNLFAAFALRGAGITDQFWTRAGTSAVLLALAVAGFTGGLKAFEDLETWAVGLKLAVIAGLVAALLFVDVSTLIDGALVLPSIAHTTGWQEVQVLLGLVILVQGFETSRYLGAEYGRAMRRKTMFRAQLIATGVYVGFLALATPFFAGAPPSDGSETAIIDMLLPLGIAVAPAIILAALASQLSAAVADLNGAGGLLAEGLGRWLSVRSGYLVAIVAALAITWSADIFEIIAYASRAFVLYYGLQCVQAIQVGWPFRQPLKPVLFGSGLVLALFILVFAAPANV